MWSRLNDEVFDIPCPIGAVSYTHLDVYKRQDILCLGTVDQVAKDPAPIFTVGRQTTFTVVASVTSCYARDDNLVSYLKAVSYTHLDVYKRQVLS